VPAGQILGIGQNIEWFEGFNLGESPEIRVIERQDSGNAVLDHERDQTGIMGLLTFGDVGVNEDHQPSRSRCSRGCRPPDAPAAYGRRPIPEAT
jgi:hypothetical protein